MRLTLPSSLIGFLGAFAMLGLVHGQDAIELPFFINAGSFEFTDPTTNVTWGTNVFDTGGSNFTLADSTTPIANTTNDKLFRTEQNGESFSYNFPIDGDQNLDVTLYMAEVFHTEEGVRVFNVSIEGELVLENLDLIEATGAINTATAYTFTVQVRDGSLDIDFDASVDQAKVSGIEVIAAAPTDMPSDMPSDTPSISPTAGSHSDVPSDVPSSSPVVAETAAPVVSETAPPPTSPSKTVRRCFSDRATVLVEHQAEPVPMHKLQVGDRVLVNGKQVYEPVYAFGHVDAVKPTTFLQISTKSTSNTPLELSEEHMIFVRGKTGPVRADSLEVGDELIRVDQGVTPTVVTRIATINRKGLYGPLTPGGTIVVDGILASTYAGVQANGVNEYVEIGARRAIPLLQADMIHMYLSPLRLVCMRVSPKFCDSHNENGVHTYVAFGMKLLQWGEKQHVVLQAAALTLTLLVLGVFGAIEFLSSPYGWLLLAAVASWRVFAKKNKQAVSV